MRIIIGKYKGRKLHPPKSLGARPTTDFAKTGLFNILTNHFDFEQLRVLDLFAGTGSIAYEFSSRSAVEVVCVDNNFQSIWFIRETAKQLQMHGIHTIHSNVFRFLKHAYGSFDIIFADPPYDMKGIETLPDLIAEKKLLSEDGWFVLEHSARVNLSNHPAFIEHRKYGAVNFSMFGFQKSIR